WQVEHAYPSKLVGWLVVALRRHATALHELTAAEFTELGALLERTVRLVHEATDSVKEYVACYAEAAGLEHIHFHVVPRVADLPAEFRGAGSFDLLRVAREDAASPDSVAAFCVSMRAAFERKC